MFSKKNLLLIIILFIGSFLRFYNLLWGAPYYFHPDERNIANVLAMPFSTQFFLKSTFSYGNFLMLLGFFLKPLCTPFFNAFGIHDSFEQAIVVLRILSATTSVIMLVILYKGSSLISKPIALGVTALAVFSTGLIQQAHFGTFDGFLIFCSVAVWYALTKLFITKSIRWYFIALIFVAFGTAAKISFIFLGILPEAITLFLFWKKKKRIFLYILLGSILLLVLPLFLSPYYLTSDFRGALLYERGVITGSLPVFYTQSFVHTIPILFAFTAIFPFLVNPLMTILFPISFVIVFVQGLRQKNFHLLLLCSMFVLLFIPQAILFAKWSRYMTPAIPFIYLISLFSIMMLAKKLQQMILFAVVCVAGVFGISFFITTYGSIDTRVQAGIFVQQTIPFQAMVLSEPYDIGIIALHANFQQIQTPQLYDIEHVISEQKNFTTIEKNTTYVILPSQRLVRSRILNPTVFPFGYSFYSKLLHEKGYKKIYQTPCDIFCTIAYSGDPIFHYEETAVVFDRPTVMIFKKK